MKSQPLSDDPAYLERIRRKAAEAPPFSEKQIAILGAIWAPHVLAQIGASHNNDRAA